MQRLGGFGIIKKFIKAGNKLYKSDSFYILRQPKALNYIENTANINLLGISNNNNFNQYHIPFNSRLVVKKNSLTDKTSNILKSLTSKNITSNKHILPKIKGKRKDSNFSCNNGVINNNNVNGNIYIIKTNNCQGNKIICNEKEKIVSKNKKLAPFSKNRTPSAKALKANSPNNNINCNCDEFCYKAKTNKKSVSNKNINLFMK